MGLVQQTHMFKVHNAVQKHIKTIQLLVFLYTQDTMDDIFNRSYEHHIIV